jgi:hypothetical protein
MAVTEWFEDIHMLDLSSMQMKSLSCRRLQTCKQKQREKKSVKLSPIDVW